MVTRSAAVAAATRSNLETRIPFTSSGASGMPRSSPRTSLPHTPWATPSSTKVRPMVAMKRLICGWFTRGRRTKRSVARAKSTITTSEAANAAHPLQPNPTRPAKVVAAKKTIAPWAKLKTPLAL